MEDPVVVKELWSVETAAADMSVAQSFLNLSAARDSERPLARARKTSCVVAKRLLRVKNTSYPRSCDLDNPRLPSRSAASSSEYRETEAWRGGLFGNVDNVDV